jgi:hypothetical protein
MTRFRQALAGALIIVGGLAFAGSSTAGAYFDVPLTPGHFRSSGTFAFATMLDPGGNNAAVSISYGRLMFRPKGAGQALIPVDGTAVYATLSTPDGVWANNCWLDSTNPLIINSGLSASAVFDSSAPGISPCPGMLINQSLTAAAVQPANLDPVQGFIGPVRFSVHWTPTQPVDDTHYVINSTCQSWTSLEQVTRSDARSAAGADFSATVNGINYNTGNFETISVDGHFDTAIGGDADVSIQNDDEVVNGPATGSCGPYGS